MGHDQPRRFATTDSRQHVTREVRDGRTTVDIRDVTDLIPPDQLTSDDPAVAKFALREIIATQERDTRCREIPDTDKVENRRAHLDRIYREMTAMNDGVCPWCADTGWFDTGEYAGECPLCR